MHHVVLICIDISSVKLALILKFIKNAQKKMFYIPLDGLQHLLLRRGRGGEEAFLLHVAVAQRSGRESLEELTH